MIFIFSFRKDIIRYFSLVVYKITFVSYESLRIEKSFKNARYFLAVNFYAICKCSRETADFSDKRAGRQQHENDLPPIGSVGHELIT